MNRWIQAYWTISGVVILAISLSALWGHWLGIANLYQWRHGPGAVGMALNTAICLALTGGALLFRLWWKDNG